MQKLVYFIVSAVILLGFMGCKKTQVVEDLPFSPYVEAFTSGTVSRFSPVRIIFTEDVEGIIPNAELKKYVKIKPDVKGEFSFDNARTLAFKPALSMDRDATYEVSVNLKAWFEDADKTPFTFGFSTLPLLLRAEQQSLDISEDSKDDDLYNVSYTLTTSDRETPETIESLVVASEKTNLPWEWTHDADERTHTLLLKNIQADKTAGSGVDRQLTLNIAKNKLGLSEGDELISTAIPSVDDFSVYRICFISEPERYVEVTFTRSLNPTQDFEGLAYLENNTNTTVTAGGNKLRLYPDPSKTGAQKINLSPSITDKHGRKLNLDIMRNTGQSSDLGIDISGGIPDIRFTGEGNIIPQTTDLVVPFQAVYLRGVVVRVIKVYEQNIGQFLQTNSLDDSNDLMSVGRLVARKTIFFDGEETDFTSWKTYAISLNKLMEPEPGAIYRIILSFTPDLLVYPCDEYTEKKTKEQMLAEDPVRFKKEVEQYDGGSYYYYYFRSGVAEDMDSRNYYDDYDWYERDNPCNKSYYYNRIREKNVLATNLGLIAMGGDNSEMTFLVHNLVTTAPERSVNISLYNYQHQLTGSGVTDDKGMAKVAITQGRPFYAIATQGRQRSYLRIDPGSALSLSSFDVSGEVVQKGIKGFIYGERGVWRPGDTLHLGFMLNDRLGTLPANHPVIMELFNPRGQSYLRKTLTHGELGLYAFDLPTEADAPTGAWNVKVQVGGTTFEKRIRLESIKPNRLKIQLTLPDKPIIRNETTHIPLHTEWMQGAVARNLKYEMKGFFSSATTSFKGYEKYKFEDPTKTFHSEESDVIEGRVDGSGDAVIDASFNIGASAPGMLTGNFTTRVYEESGDFSIDGVSIPYSPYSRYIGIKSPQNDDSQLNTDANHTFEVVSLSSDGKPSSTRLEIQVYKIRWYWWWYSDNESLANYISDQTLIHQGEKYVTTGSDGKGRFTLNMGHDDWGTYLVRVKDQNGSHSTGVLAYFDWPGYGDQRSSQARSTSPALLTIKTDKESYATGEKMKLTFPSPEGSRAIVSIENGSTILSTTEHICEAGETTIRIDVTPDMQPNAYAFVTILQPYNHKSNDLPIRLYGVVPFKVTSPDSYLHPVITTATEFKPEEPYTVTVSEENGKAMAYTLAVVDEGLLDLTHFPTPDPWKAFNAREALGISTWDLYNFILGAYGGRIEQVFSIGGDGALAGPKAVVNRFKPVVEFAGPFVLKKGEKKKHTFTMPNYNGRVRVMVVAGDGSAYGNTEKSVMVRKPVMLLGTLPRVIGIDEEMAVPATVFATEDNIGNVQVSISCSNNMEVVGSSTQTLSFSRKEDKTAFFRVRVKSQTGAGHVTLTAVAKGEKTTYETDIEIRSVRHKQTKVQTVTLDANKSWKGSIALPGAEGTNSLMLEVSGIPPIDLSRRLHDLLGYPYGCLEQITSKAFPQLYLKELASVSTKQEASIEVAVKSVINRYRSYQYDGAFSYWPGGTSQNYWGTVYATHFMVEAANKGYFVPDGIKNTALSTMRRTARDWKPASDRNYYGSSESTQAYRLYVLALAHQQEVGAMNRLKENTSLSPLSRWMLSAAYALIGRQDVANDLISRTVEQQTTYTAYDYTYGSYVRDWGIALQTLTLLNKGQEATAIVEKLSKKLSSEDWLNTQETAFSLIGLSAYMSRYKTSEGLDFAYTVGGKSNTVNSSKAIWSETLYEEGAASASVEVKNNKAATLYVRFISEGTPSQGEEKASSGGITLDVSYQGDGGRSVDVNNLAQGVNFTAVVTVRNPTLNPIQNLVVSQVFPAGWEILNTRFLPQESTKETSSAQINYQDIRDDRVFSFIDWLGSGQQVTFRINLSSVYAGKFYLPPVFCEAMYDNKIQANTEGRQVTVE
ncbi:hypothetical protein FACS189411_02360 [Bacteroidia bacterium]|nr:hypothetical protein FACS189411_02360 [Bacteroidia bacterium]